MLPLNFTSLNSRSSVAVDEPSTPATLGSRQRTHADVAGNKGVWTAALFLAVSAFLMPVWFLAAGSTFASGMELATSVSLHWVQTAVLALGAVALWSGSGASAMLAGAPRLANGHHRSAMRWLAIAASICGACFIFRMLTDPAGVPSDALCYLTAIMPAALFAQSSFALPAITKGKYGTEIGWFGGWCWAAAGASLALVAAAPGMWWLPTGFALAGAFCTGMASVRVWRRYEGGIVGA